MINFILQNKKLVFFLAIVKFLYVASIFSFAALLYFSIILPFSWIMIVGMFASLIVGFIISLYKIKIEGNLKNKIVEFNQI